MYLGDMPLYFDCADYENDGTLNPVINCFGIVCDGAYLCRSNVISPLAALPHTIERITK